MNEVPFIQPALPNKGCMYVQISKFTWAVESPIPIVMEPELRPASLIIFGKNFSEQKHSAQNIMWLQIKCNHIAQPSSNYLRVYRWGKFKLLIKACTSPHPLKQNRGPCCGTRFLCMVRVTSHQNTTGKPYVTYHSSLVLSSLTKRLLKETLQLLLF